MAPVAVNPTAKHKYALLLMAAVAMTATGAMAQAFAQSTNDGMDGYQVGVPGAGIYTGNPNECWWIQMTMAPQTCIV